MEKEYLIAFSSFYKAAYARDLLEEEGFAVSLAKLPAELLRSCGTGVLLRTDDPAAAERFLQERQITTRGIYEAAGLRRFGRPQNADLSL